MTLSLCVERDAAHIFIDFPEINNGLSREVVQELTNMIVEQNQRTDLRFLVIHGAPKWFCIGASGETLAKAIELGHAERVSLTSDFQETVIAILSSGLFTVAVLDGLAAGAGVDIALACDLRLATSSARLSLLYSKLGLVPDTGFNLLRERLSKKDPLLLYAESSLLKQSDMVLLGLAEAAPPSVSNYAELSKYLNRRFRFDAWALRSTKQANFESRLDQLVPDLHRAAQAQASALNRPETQQRVLRSAAFQDSSVTPKVTKGGS